VGDIAAAASICVKPAADGVEQLVRDSPDLNIQRRKSFPVFGNSFPFRVHGTFPSHLNGHSPDIL
jgi:hypothetical protein